MAAPCPGDDPAPPRRQTDPLGPKTMTDLLALADAERTLVHWLVRQRGASLEQIVAHLHHPPAEVEAMLEALMGLGFLIADTAAEPVIFRPNLISHRPRTIPGSLWDALSQEVGP